MPRISSNHMPSIKSALRIATTQMKVPNQDGVGNWSASSASVASDTVRGVRMQGIAADEALGRVRDRLWIRRGRGRTGTPTAGSGAGEAVDMTPGVDAGPIPRQP